MTLFRFRVEPRPPLRRWRGFTWIGWTNRMVLRWIGLRIEWLCNGDGDERVIGYGLEAAWPWSRWPLGFRRVERKRP